MGAGTGARPCEWRWLKLVSGLTVAAGVAALAVHVGRLFHCFAGGAAILARADGTGTDGVSALIGFVGHDVSSAATASRRPACGYGEAARRKGISGRCGI